VIILLGDFNPKIGTADISRPTVGNKRLHKISNDNGVRVVDFATSKNLIIRRAIFPHCDIHKFTWTSPNGKTHSHTDRVLIDMRRHSVVLDIQSFRGVDCDTSHCLVVAEVREKQAVSK
jgi:hypothetical protein